MKWSVVIPIHKPELGLLRRCLASVVGRKADCNVVVPDGMEVMVCDQTGHPGMCFVGAWGLRLVHHPRATTLAEAWNRCIAEAKGEWIHLLHYDDWVAEGFYAALEEGLSSPDVGAAATGYANVRPGGEITFIQQYPFLMSQARHVEGMGTILRRSNPFQCPAVVVKRSTYDAVGGFKELGHGTDWEMWHRIVCRFRWWLSPRILAFWYDSPCNTSSESRERNERDLARTRAVILGEKNDRWSDVRCDFGQGRRELA